MVGFFDPTTIQPVDLPSAFIRTTTVPQNGIGITRQLDGSRFRGEHKDPKDKKGAKGGERVERQVKNDRTMPKFVSFRPFLRKKIQIEIQRG